MTNMMKTALLASIPAALLAAIPATVFAQAAAPAPAAIAGTGVAIADLDEAVNKSNAWVLAVNQIKLTHAATITQFENRANAINAELQPAATAIQNAQRAPNPNQAAIQTQVAAFQKRQQDAEAELQRIRTPVTRAEAFSKQQIVEKLETATRNAMNAKRIGLLLKPEAALLNSTGSDLTNDIIAQLNALVAQVNTNPPANWPPQPGAAAAPAAPAPAAPAGTRPPAPRPSGR